MTIDTITLQDMYFALVNSVATTITGAIGASDTTIYVLDDSRIPDPPNLLVLGENSALAETVKLLEKDGTKLTVVRGFQGSARAWNEGTTIARNFTAYDADTFKKNIEMLADGHNALVTDHKALSKSHGELQISHEKLTGDVDKLSKDVDELGDEQKVVTKKFTDHENAELHHLVFVSDGEQSETYHYGFRVDWDGTLVFMWDQEPIYE